MRSPLSELVEGRGMSNSQSFFGKLWMVGILESNVAVMFHESTRSQRKTYSVQSTISRFLTRHATSSVTVQFPR